MVVERRGGLKAEMISLFLMVLTTFLIPSSLESVPSMGDNHIQTWKNWEKLRRGDRKKKNKTHGQFQR